MSGQVFLYNNGVKTTLSPTFNVAKPTLIRGGNITTPVPIYMMVGDCPDCQPSDIVWAPLIWCGVPVVLSPTNTSVMLAIPNKYSLGDPNVPLVLATNVNITMQAGVDPSLVGKCPPVDSSPLAVEIASSCLNPVFVEVCLFVFVETVMVDLGCITDATGQQIGKVFLVRTVNEITGSVSVIQSAYFENGTVVNPYTGPWSVCDQDKCQPLASRGLQPLW